MNESTQDTPANLDVGNFSLTIITPINSPGASQNDWSGLLSTAVTDAGATADPTTVASDNVTSDATDSEQSDVASSDDRAETGVSGSNGAANSSSSGYTAAAITSAMAAVFQPERGCKSRRGHASTPPETAGEHANSDGTVSVEFAAKVQIALQLLDPKIAAWWIAGSVQGVITTAQRDRLDVVRQV